jgi:hypothetical protein
MNMASIAAPKPKPSRSVAAEDEHDDRGSEQTQADRGHADMGPGAKRDTHGPVTAGVARRRRHSHVGPDGKPHAEEADQTREDRAGQEGHRARDLQRPGAVLVAGVHRQEEKEDEREHGEDAQRPELPGEIGAGPLLHGAGDGLHVGGAVTGRQDLAPEHHRHHQRDHGDDSDDGNERQVDPRQGYWHTEVLSN